MPELDSVSADEATRLESGLWRCRTGAGARAYEPDQIGASTGWRGAQMGKLSFRLHGFPPRAIRCSSRARHGGGIRLLHAACDGAGSRRDVANGLRLIRCGRSVSQLPRGGRASQSKAILILQSKPDEPSSSKRPTAGSPWCTGWKKCRLLLPTAGHRSAEARDRHAAADWFGVTRGPKKATCADRTPHVAPIPPKE